MKLTGSQKEDYKRYFNEKGDPGFSPKRNREVIAKVIKDTDRRMAKAKAKFKEDIGERSDAVYTYLRSDTAQPIEKYFGKRELARLRGEKIRQVIKDNVIHIEEMY